MDTAPMENRLTRFRAALRKWKPALVLLRNKLFAGIVFAIPLIVTVWVLKIAYHFIASIGGQFFPNSPDGRYSFLSFLVTIIFLMALGFMVTNVFGQRLLVAGELLLLRVPIVA